ncbi:histidine kinase dimerization/phospho-acceptor domain-containing protein [Actinoplanes sp. CA-142083]|uniref:histidine kinase dimerization/phospho-acceptor domain-containing protein n=1 Tax=Actinoplanes sp. CA-142083 TaxID=3239903 RepID=UPI003D8AAC1E
MARSLFPLPGLRRVSLRAKLVASVLVLVFAALVLISLASAFVVRRYLISRMDDQLRTLAGTAAEVATSGDRAHTDWAFVPPEYLAALTTVAGAGELHADGQLTAADLPALLSGAGAIDAHAGRPYTARSANGAYRWRMLVIRRGDDVVVHVGQRMTGIDDAITQLVRADVLAGLGALIALASAGAALVRQSLIPLLRIERTAAAIGAGDLSQRVPDPEGHARESRSEPATELGRLARALNAMLAQIEAAFTARAASEQEARQAAEAARLSESRALASEAKMGQFVADASDELRAPLTTIRGSAEQYRLGAVTDAEDVARLVRRIEDEAARMGLLVEDLLLPARRDPDRPSFGGRP